MISVHARTPRVAVNLPSVDNNVSNLQACCSTNPTKIINAQLFATNFQMLIHSLLKRARLKRSRAGPQKPADLTSSPYSPIPTKQDGSNRSKLPLETAARNCRRLGSQKSGPGNAIPQALKTTNEFHNLDTHPQNVEIRSPKPFEFINIPSKHSRANNTLLRPVFRKIKSLLNP